MGQMVQLLLPALQMQFGPDDGVSHPHVSLGVKVKY